MIYLQSGVVVPDGSDLQNTVTYIAGVEAFAELGSTRGLGRIELVSQESKSIVRELRL